MDIEYVMDMEYAAQFSRTNSFFFLPRRFDPEFIECRRVWLDEYMTCLVRVRERHTERLREGTRFTERGRHS